MLEKKSIRQLKYSDNVMLTQLCKLQYYSLIHTFNKKWRCLLLPYIYTSNSACSFFFFFSASLYNREQATAELAVRAAFIPNYPHQSEGVWPSSGGNLKPTKHFLPLWSLFLSVDANNSTPSFSQRDDLEFGGWTIRAERSHSFQCALID